MLSTLLFNVPQLLLLPFMTSVSFEVDVLSEGIMLESVSRFRQLNDLTLVEIEQGVAKRRLGVLIIGLASFAGFGW